MPVSGTVQSADMTAAATVIPSHPTAINVVKTTYTTNATVSADLLIQMHRLPAGAQVVFTGLKTDSAGEGDAADTYSVTDKDGNIYSQSAIPATTDIGIMGFGNGNMTEISGSSYMQVRIQAKAATGTGSHTIQLMTGYLCQGNKV